MNILFNKKINPKLQINLNELSSTSDFSLDNYNIKHQINKNKIIKGGNCPCSDIFKAISNQNIELILYIIKHDEFCMRCQNELGDTVLHLLIPYYNYKEIKEYFDTILDYDCSDFINIQNNKGQTPILIAVINDNIKLAEQMENAGADPTIEDYQGNFVATKDNPENLVDNDCVENIIVNPPTPTYNIYNLFIQKPNNDLSSLNINDLSSLNINDTIDNMTQKKSYSEISPTSTSTHLEFNKIINIVNNAKLSSTSPSTTSSSSEDSENIEIPNMDEDILISPTSLDTDKFITLLDSNNKPSFVNYSDIEDTDQYISILTDKYASQTKHNPNSKSKPIINSDTSNMNLSIGTQANRLMNETTSDDNNLNTNTSDINFSINSQVNKLMNETTSDENVSNNIFTKYQSQTKNPPNSNIFTDNKTSDMNTSIDSQANRLINETTSDDFINPKSNSKPIPMSIPLTSNPYINIISNTSNDNQSEQMESIKPNSNIFYKTNTNFKSNFNTKQVSSDIDTSTLYKAINKIVENYPGDKLNKAMEKSKIMEGGSRKTNTKQQIMGYRKFNQDSELEFVNNYLSTDYNKIYNSDSEIGSKSKNILNQNLDPSVVELSRMMSRQKENIHQEVLESIMGMLNRGVLLQSNKPIEASEKNAKLVKAFLYRQICEQNPDLGGMDKILAIKSMSENDIINMVKKMPSLDELEKNINKHLEEKNKNKLKKTDDSSNNISTEESSESVKPKNKKMTK